MIICSVGVLRFKIFCMTTLESTSIKVHVYKVSFFLSNVLNSRLSSAFSPSLLILVFAFLRYSALE